jgi:hypothetical protein
VSLVLLPPQLPSTSYVQARLLHTSNVFRWLGLDDCSKTSLASSNTLAAYLMPHSSTKVRPI